jgi:hypothetical protein
LLLDKELYLYYVGIQIVHEIVRKIVRVDGH